MFRDLFSSGCTCVCCTCCSGCCCLVLGAYAQSEAFELIAGFPSCSKPSTSGLVCGHPPRSPLSSAKAVVLHRAEHTSAARSLLMHSVLCDAFEAHQRWTVWSSLEEVPFLQTWHAAAACIVEHVTCGVKQARCRHCCCPAASGWTHCLQQCTMPSDASSCCMGAHQLLECSSAIWMHPCLMHTVS